MVLGYEVEVTRLWGVVRGLLGYVVSSGVVGQVPVAGEYFAKNRVQRLLDSGRPDVPATEVELYDRYESFDGIIDIGNR